MIFFPTTKSTENKEMAEIPKVISEEGKFNELFFQECGEYFVDHIALRNQMIYTDAMIQTRVFSESNIGSVIYGENDWLYYASTLDDYSGRGAMSERELFNLSHNLKVVEEYLKEKDIDFVFTIPPNKNTLYYENMPYYTEQGNLAHNAERLSEYLEEQGISYLDLFRLFRAQDDVLYLQRDSHWNMKGACLAYDAVMDSLGKKHNDYSDENPVVENKTNGDLNKMLYSFYGETEENYSYSLPRNYNYKNDVSGVEDGWIITENKQGSGTLLMFRDSFADTLIPFISNEFKTAYYSKGQPNAMERYIEEDKPDCVIIEKVERNISDYLITPPIITPPSAELPENITITSTESDVKIELCSYDADYFTVNGTVDSSRITEHSEVVVAVNDKLYSAYQTEENGFVIYLKKKTLTGENADVQVYVNDGNNSIRVVSSIIALPQ